MEKIEIVTEKNVIDNTEVSDSQLVESLEIPFEMMDMDILVKPLPPVMVNKILTEPDDQKNKNLKVGQLMHMKSITREVQAAYRKGVVLAMGPNANSIGFNIEVGDTVVFPSRVENNTFDLYRDALLLVKYDIKAKVKIIK